MFEEQAKQELFETVKAFHACKQEEGQSVSSYLLKMKSYLDTLECLGYAMPHELGLSLILNSLNKDYDQFVQNYNMYSMGKTIAELHAMLKLHEKVVNNWLWGLAAETFQPTMESERVVVSNFSCLVENDCGGGRLRGTFNGRGGHEFLFRGVSKQKSPILALRGVDSSVEIQGGGICRLGHIYLSLNALTSFSVMGSCQSLMMNALEKYKSWVCGEERDGVSMAVGRLPIPTSSG
ncbi:hypothetical protein Tco_0257025 [Tanacetum coccineum]